MSYFSKSEGRFFLYWILCKPSANTKTKTKTQSLHYNCSQSSKGSKVIKKICFNLGVRGMMYQCRFLRYKQKKGILGN